MGLDKNGLHIYKIRYIELLNDYVSIMYVTTENEIKAINFYNANISKEMYYFKSIERINEETENDSVHIFLENIN